MLIASSNSMTQDYMDSDDEAFGVLVGMFTVAHNIYSGVVQAREMLNFSFALFTDTVSVMYLYFFNDKFEYVLDWT
jgi:hypothetical protein